MRVDTIKTGQVVIGGIFDGRCGVLADVETEQHITGILAAQGGTLHVGQESVQSIVVEAQAVDQRLRLWQAKNAGLGVAALWLGCDGTNLHKSKTHGPQAVNTACIFIQAGRQSDPVGKLQPRQCDGVVHTGVGVRPLQRGALRSRQRRHGDFVGHFCVQAEQGTAGQPIGNKRHWIIPAILL